MGTAIPRTTLIYYTLHGNKYSKFITTGVIVNLNDLFSMKKIQLREDSGTVGYPASEVMDRIERGSRLAIYQGLQAMSYEGIGPAHQLNALSPYAQEIADYLNRSLAKWPDDKSVIAQVLRLLSIGARWPELQHCINKNKDSIVRYILTRVKENITDSSWDKKLVINNILDSLNDININWPELEVIRHSLDNKPVNEDRHPSMEYLDYAEEEFSKEGDAWVREGLESIVDFLIKGGDQKLAVALADKHKDRIVKTILSAIRHGFIPFAKKCASHLAEIGVTWPEFSIIQKSLKADKKIDEDAEIAADEEDDDQTMRNFVLGSVKTNLKSGNIGAALNVIQADLKIADIKPEAKVAWFKQHVSPLLNRNKPKILKWFAASIDAVTMPRIASAYKLLNLLDIEIPDLLDLLNSQKDHIVKRLLQVVKNHASTDPVIKDVQLLKELGIKWPELEVIERSADANKSITEDHWDQDDFSSEEWPTRSNISIDDLVAAIKKNDFESAGFLLYHLKDEYTMGDLVARLPYYGAKPDELKPFLEKYKYTIVQDILFELKQGQIHDVNLALIGLRAANADWPEIAIIDRSLQADKRNK